MQNRNFTLAGLLLVTAGLLLLLARGLAPNPSGPEDIGLESTQDRLPKSTRPPQQAGPQPQSPSPARSQMPTHDLAPVGITILGAPRSAFPFQLKARVQTQAGVSSELKGVIQADGGHLDLPADWSRYDVTASSGPWFGRSHGTSDLLSADGDIMVRVSPSPEVSLEVRDPDGYPLEGVAITSERRRPLDWSAAEGWHYERILLGQTAPDGRATIRAEVGGALDLFLYAPGFLPGHIGSDQLERGAPTIVTLAQAPVVHGTTPDLKPSAELKVIGVTDPLSVSDGMPAVLWDKNTDYAPVSEILSLSPRERFQCELETSAPGLLLCSSKDDPTPLAFAPVKPGTFVTLNDWTPIEETRLVGFSPTDLPPGASLATVATRGRATRVTRWQPEANNPGTWRSGCVLSPGRYTIQISVGGVLFQEFAADLGPGACRIQLPPSRPRTHHLTVTVIDARTGEVLPDARVIAQANSSAPLQGPVPIPIHATSDALGVCEFEFPLSVTAVQLSTHANQDAPHPALSSFTTVQLGLGGQTEERVAMRLEADSSVSVRVEGAKPHPSSGIYRIAIVRSGKGLEDSASLNERVAIDLGSMTTHRASFEVQAALTRGNTRILFDGLPEAEYEVRAIKLAPDSRWCDVLGVVAMRSAGLNRVISTKGGETLEVSLTDETRVFMGRVLGPSLRPAGSPTIGFYPLRWVKEGYYEYDFSVGPFVAPLQADGSFQVSLPGPWPYVAAVVGLGETCLLRIVDLGEQDKLDLVFNSELQVMPSDARASQPCELSIKLSLVGPDMIEMAWPPGLSRELAVHGALLPYTLRGLAPNMLVRVSAVTQDGVVSSGSHQVVASDSLEVLTLEPEAPSHR